MEEPADNVQLETDGGTLQPEPEPEQISEGHPADAHSQDSPSLSPSHPHISAAEPQDDLNSFSPQPDISNGWPAFNVQAAHL